MCILWEGEVEDDFKPGDLLIMRYESVLQMEFSRAEEMLWNACFCCAATRRRRRISQAKFFVLVQVIIYAYRNGETYLIWDTFPHFCFVDFVRNG